MKSIQESRSMITASGTETYLIFQQGTELREFCGFEVFRQPEGLAQLERDNLTPIADAALACAHDLLLDVMVWRASSDYIAKLGYPDDAVESINRQAVQLTKAFVDRWRRSTPGGERLDVFFNADMGPRGDGYRVSGKPSEEQALAYHRRQVAVLAEAGVDVISALTMTHTAEAIAIARAADEVGLPCLVSPTVETDGKTPDGLTLGQFIEEVEDRTQGSPLFYMVNCAHPVHLEGTLRDAKVRRQPWLERFKGFRANASQKSHAELDACTELDRGHPEALASQMAHLAADFDLRLIGGCCGTDHQHIHHMARATSRAVSPAGAQVG